MDVSGVTSGATYPSADAAESSRTILVTKKQMDVQKDQAAALLDLVRQSVSADGTGQLIDVRA
jgi:hypothetical protein